MRLLILGLNYSPERIGVGVYTSGLAEFLASRGHEVHVIAGRPFYPEWRPLSETRKSSASGCDGDFVKVTRVWHWIPRRPTGARRLLHHCTFALAATLPVFSHAIRKRPHVVLAIAPALIAAPVAAIAAGLTGARSWLHVQDCEVDAAAATQLLRNRPLVRLGKWFEAWTLRLFDAVSSISPMMCDRVVNKGVPTNRVSEFRNWADCEMVQPQTAPSTYRAEWNISARHVALYSGSISNKQGLGTVLQAARQLRQRRDIVFVIVGNGPYVPALQALAANLPNVIFKPLQPRARLSDLLNLATLHLLPQVAGTEDLVLPSKLNNMLASGRPIVAMATPGTALAAEVKGAGLLVAPGDAFALSRAIESLVAQPELMIQLGATARTLALARWARESVLSDFERRLISAASTSGRKTKTATAPASSVP